MVLEENQMPHMLAPLVNTISSQAFPWTSRKPTTNSYEFVRECDEKTMNSYGFHPLLLPSMHHTSFRGIILWNLYRTITIILFHLRVRKICELETMDFTFTAENSQESLIHG